MQYAIGPQSKRTGFVGVSVREKARNTHMWQAARFAAASESMLNVCRVE
jgi:hypothetical protein